MNNIISWSSEIEDTRPSIIFLEDFNTFSSLVKYKDDIKKLKLVPIKSDEMHIKYHKEQKEYLIKSINFNKNKIILLPNKYPYLLPKDTSQNIIWIQNDVSDYEIFLFIENILKELNLNQQEIILFERPHNITTKLLKKSFPFIKHIHFWYEKRIN